METLVSHCDWDRRFMPEGHRTGVRGAVNRRSRREVCGLPLWGHAIRLSIENGQLKIGVADQHIEHLLFVDPGMAYTCRFCRFVSPLAWYITIATVAAYISLAWRTVKAMDQRALTRDVSALNPGALSGLRYRGVVEVARARDHDYLTLVYNLVTGNLLWVAEIRRAAGLVAFFDALGTAVAQGIVAATMDMWLAFEQAVRQTLRSSTIDST